MNSYGIDERVVTNVHKMEPGGRRAVEPQTNLNHACGSKSLAWPITFGSNLCSFVYAPYEHVDD